MMKHLNTSDPASADFKLTPDINAVIVVMNDVFYVVLVVIPLLL